MGIQEEMVRQGALVLLCVVCVHCVGSSAAPIEFAPIQNIEEEMKETLHGTTEAASTGLGETEGGTSVPNFDQMLHPFHLEGLNNVGPTAEWNKTKLDLQQAQAATVKNFEKLKEVAFDPGFGGNGTVFPTPPNKTLPNEEEDAPVDPDDRRKYDPLVNETKYQNVTMTSDYDRLEKERLARYDPVEREELLKQQGLGLDKMKPTERAALEVDSFLQLSLLSMQQTNSAASPVKSVLDESPVMLVDVLHGSPQTV